MLVWLASALVIAAASFVMGLAGFGIALVALAFLPYLMPASMAIVLLTVYTVVFCLVLFVQLRRDVELRELTGLFVGTVAGAPLGVWVLTALPATLLNRSIGLMLVVIATLEFRGLLPSRLDGRGWGVGAGVLSGLIGGAVGTPGPPAVVYMASRGRSPRTTKANLQAFFLVNQSVILTGYWWAGMLTTEVARLALSLAVPAAVGAAAGVALFDRIDHRRFRQIVFALLLVSGLVLLARG